MATKFLHFYSNYGGLILSKNYKKKKEIIKDILLKCKYTKNVITYNSPNLPDMIIILKDKYLFSVKSSFFIKNRFNSFNHSDKGVFFAYGKNIKRGKQVEIEYIDLIPTLLKLYNLDKADHMKGNILNILK